MPEWSIGAVSKTVDQLAWSQGSNPCLSATKRLKSSKQTYGSFFYVEKIICHNNVNKVNGFNC